MRKIQKHTNCCCKKTRNVTVMVCIYVGCHVKQWEKNLVHLLFVREQVFFSLLRNAFLNCLNSEQALFADEIIEINSSMYDIFLILKERGGGAVSYSLRPASGRLGVLIPAATDLSRKTFKCSASLLSNTRQEVVASRVLGDDHYKLMSCVSVGVAC